MRQIISTVICICFVPMLLCSAVLSAESHEHRTFARTALESVLTDCEGSACEAVRALFVRNDSLTIDAPLWGDSSFADISVAFSGADLSRARNHLPGRTILEQLEPLTPDLIERCWSEVESEESAVCIEQRKGNVVSNYLLHHLMALRFAHRAARQKTGGSEDLRSALVYEAMGLSYLVDAFSSAHMFIDYKALSALQAVNYRKAHRFFRTEGAYMINSRGDAWRTFGDGLMLWSEPTYRFTLTACMTSLKELFVVYERTLDQDGLSPVWNSLESTTNGSFSVTDWIISRPGGEYYAELKMPSLLRLPMPVAASWSLRSDDVDEHGIHRRIHFPQLREAGFHDPDLEGIDPKFLYSRESIPDWLIVDELKNTSHPDGVRKLVREDAGIASVRYVQQRHCDPSSVGLLLNAAGGATYNGHRRSTTMAGLGAGLVDDLWFIHNLSLDMMYIHMSDGTDQSFVTTTAGLSIHTGLPRPLDLLQSFRLEAGHAWEKGRDVNLFHYKYAAGIELPAIPLGFTYAALRPRLMAHRIYTGSEYHGFSVQLVVQ